MPVFLVTQEAMSPFKTASIDAIVDGIEGIHPERNSYYVVQKLNRDYIQFAGSREALVAEMRVYAGNQFAHSVIGYDIEPGLIATVECNVGPIRVNQSQVLSITDAKRLIAAFCRNLPWPEGYRLADVTERFG